MIFILTFFCSVTIRHSLATNGPFAAGDHIVQKPPHWRANCALGHIKQRKFKFGCFVLDVPVRNLLSSMAVFVPCDHQLQRAHLKYRRCHRLRKKKEMTRSLLYILTTVINLLQSCHRGQIRQQCKYGAWFSSVRRQACESWRRCHC